MKILIICSTSFYDKIETIKKELIKKGYIVKMPNCYDEPVTNEDNKKMTEEEYQKLFNEMHHQFREIINNIDAVLVLNYDKEKMDKNTITILEHQLF